MCNEEIDRLGRMLQNPARITVVSHVNPDGDAIGSGIALTLLLRKLGHEARFFVPNNYPSFLGFLSGIGLVEVYRNRPEEISGYIKSSEWIFCLDFNQIVRLEELGRVIRENGNAKRVLIDHHLHPPQEFDLAFSDVSCSSTSLLLYRLIGQCGWTQWIDRAMAEALFVGIDTDTGNFTFGNLSPEVYTAAAHLISYGIDPAEINIALYNNFSVSRMRLMGYLLHEKMRVIPESHAAFMTLTKEEQLKFNFRQGDSEGFVNLPLSIQNIRLTAFFIETTECIKVSLRSQGDTDVNVMARDYFNGGGHKNAAGGKSFDTMENTIRQFYRALKGL